MEEVKEVKKKGFALLTPERRREISRSGGKAAHAAGTGHHFTSETAKIAGRMGGMAIARKRREGTVGMPKGSDSGDEEKSNP